ncbi:MAG: hypothetical protein Q9179_004983 [Wetmoreana sp. 5 TL-2023]
MDRTEHGLPIVTKVLPINVERVGTFVFKEPSRSFLDDWDIHLDENSRDAANLRQAVRELQTSSLPVAFPTETVYGLGADATRGDAVAGIYQAKQRPADNPLIVHISSLNQLRRLLTPASGSPSKFKQDVGDEFIPPIYNPLISRFWPGPLTILLPLPKPSPLAPAVTGTLSSFGVRMPSSKLALALIHLADVPIAAPSANASTKPSPTAADHVLHDLSGRIHFIVDGGPCTVGVESTVVDGLADPPVILRPGGVSIEMLRHCPGWENVTVAYEDGIETSAPRAPGMKYKHYSPKARVILVSGSLSVDLVRKYIGTGRAIGLAKTTTWKDDDLTARGRAALKNLSSRGRLRSFTLQRSAASSSSEPSDTNGRPPLAQHALHDEVGEQSDSIQVSSIDLGLEAASVARNLFSALRELDLAEVDVIFVEAIDESEGHAVAAIMNRLRKAAELQIQV